MHQVGSRVKRQKHCSFPPSQYHRRLKIKLTHELIYSCMKIDRVASRKIKYGKISYNKTVLYLIY